MYTLPPYTSLNRSNGSNVLFGIDRGLCEWKLDLTWKRSCQKIDILEYMDNQLRKIIEFSAFIQNVVCKALLDLILKRSYLRDQK